jgi:hypothetical protein
MNRPVGVTILAILDFIGAAFAVIFAILCFAGGGILASVMSQSQAQGGGAGLAALFGAGAAIFGIVCLVFAALYALIGWGMWGLKNWARIVTLVLVGLGALNGLYGLVTHFNVFGIVVLAIQALIIWYLLKPDVAGAFKGAQGSAASA